MLKIRSKLIASAEYVPLESSGQYTKFVDKHTKDVLIKSPVADPWDLDLTWDISVHIDTGKNRSGVRYAKSLVFQLNKPVEKPDHSIDKIVESANFAYLEESGIAFYAFPVPKNSGGGKWAIYKISNLFHHLNK